MPPQPAPQAAVPPVYQPPVQPQYYSLSEAPVEKRSIFKEKKVLLLLGIALFAMLVAVVGIVLALNLTKNNSARVAALNNAKSIAEQAASACDAGDAVCLLQAQSGAARQVGEVEACKTLEGDRYASCVTLIAFDKKDPELCGSLSATAKTTCMDGAFVLVAQEQHDFMLCAKVTNEISRLSCEATLRSDAAMAGDCAAYHVDASVCEGETALRSVIDLGDPKGCATLSGDYVATCEDLFASLDEDKDGLSLQEEFELGTSPTNPDTDGDGYTDGEEVASGHNPRIK